MRNVFGPAGFHTSDYPAYWENIRENVKIRIKAYMYYMPDKDVSDELI